MGKEGLGDNVVAEGTQGERSVNEDTVEAGEDFNISSGFEMMQPYWEKFRKGIEQRQALLKKKNDKHMEIKEKEIKNLQHEMDVAKKEYEAKIERIKTEYEENIKDLEDKHAMQMESLKIRVRSTLNESDRQAADSELAGIREDEKQSGIGEIIYFYSAIQPVLR